MASEIVVALRCGTLKGFVECAGLRKINVNVFHNVPFAQPPLGNLRFMHPRPALPWKGILDCTRRGKIPWQSTLLNPEADKLFAYRAGIDRSENACSEDCLQLSIYTPKTSNTAKLPVMVWIYGGAFVIGSSDIYDGTILSSMNDIVVVVPNYRVNAFGFLSLGRNSICPGNAGLWVKDNITSFGGDPDNVTIFGESAGGVSVGLHVNSPESKGLFHKAITHSGEASMPMPTGLFVQNERNLTVELCNLLNIDCKDDKDILSQLQQKNPSEINRATEMLILKRKNFLPVVDGTFVTMAPVKNRPAIEYMCNVPRIIGFNNSETLGILSNPSVKGFNKGIPKSYAIRLNQIFLKQNWPEIDNNQVANMLEKHYLGKLDANDPCFYSKYYAAIQHDALFRLPAHMAAHGLSDSGIPTYVYHGAFQLRFNHSKEYGPNNAHKPDWVGCDHYDDVAMTFGTPFATYDFLTEGIKFTDEEKNLSSKMMTYFTNFARTGNPNGNNSKEVEWPKYKSNEANCLQLGTDKIHAIHDDPSEDVALWSNITSIQPPSKL